MMSFYIPQSMRSLMTKLFIFFERDFSQPFFFIFLCVMIQKNVEIFMWWMKKSARNIKKHFLHRRWNRNEFFSSSSSLLNFQQEIYNLEPQVLFFFASLCRLHLFLMWHSIFSLSFLSLYLTTLDTSLMWWPQKNSIFLLLFFLLLDVAHIILWTMHSFIYFGRLTN